MQRVIQQLRSILHHLTNVVVNDLLGNDIASCAVRKTFLKLMGNNLGAGTNVKGGCYFYGGGLITGKDCFINRGCYFDFSAPITFDDNVVVGHGVTFITAVHNVCTKKRRAGRDVTGQAIQIGSGTWIGANATILPLVTIGQGVIIAAGAVVTKNVPDNVMVAGVPAKEIKTLEA